MQRTNRAPIFRGAIYECTFNCEGKFSHSQAVLLFELPTQDDLDNWQKIKVLVAPLGIKDIEYDNTMSKEAYIEIGFREVKIGTAPQQTHHLANNIQGQRK